MFLEGASGPRVKKYGREVLPAVIFRLYFVCFPLAVKTVEYYADSIVCAAEEGAEMVG